jgi:hypothetical protein
LVVDDIEAVVKRAVTSGGKVLETNVFSGSVLYVLQGPPSCTSLRIILSETSPVRCFPKSTTRAGEVVAKPSLIDGFMATFAAWCSGSDEGKEKEEERGGAGAAAGDQHLKRASGCSSHVGDTGAGGGAWRPPTGPVIPTIFPSVLHCGEFRPIPPNSSTPIPFKTEHFEGELLLLVRTTPLEPRYKNIFQKVSGVTKKVGTTTFEVQCQGRFTKIPQGRLYIGAEITKKMNLGLFTRGLCYTVLQFVNSINPFIHSSFGDNENAELPHITGPLWSLADKIVVTPEGGVAPQLGQLLPEEEGARAERRSRPLHEEVVDLTSTYSFSVNTDNIELCDWNMVNVPLTNSMDLHTFWDDADIRLCCYCVPSTDACPPRADALDAKSLKAVAKSLPKYHYQASNQYLLCVQLEHLSNHPGRAPNSGPSANTAADLLAATTAVEVAPRPEDEDDAEDDDMESVDSDEEMFFDAVDGHDFDENNNDDITYFASEKAIISRSSSFPPRPRSIFRSVARELPGAVYNFVPAMVLVSDVIRRRSVLGVGSAPRELYLFCVPASLFPAATSTSALPSALYPSPSCYLTLQSYKEFSSKFDMEGCFKTHAYSRMSRTEQRRKDLQHSIVQVMRRAAVEESVRSNLMAFFGVSRHTEYFLRSEEINAKHGKRNGVGNPRLRGDLGPSMLMEGFVCTRQGQSHWAEEYLCLTSEELVFIQHSPRLSEKKRRRIPLEFVLSFRAVNSKECSFPMEDCHCMLISTFPREYCVLVRDKSELARWLAVLPPLLEAKSRNAINSQIPLANSFKQLELFSHPLDWKLGTRVLLNGRRYCGRGVFESPDEAVAALQHTEQGRESWEHGGGQGSRDGDSATNSCRLMAISEIKIQHNSHHFPLLLVERALLLISEISIFSNSMENILSWDSFLETHWMEYLDVVSLLPCIDLEMYDLSSDECICLYLNLYHTMLLHAVLVAGVPSTLMKWPSFFNSFSYEAFGDVFSLSELEHSVIKGGE